jgi:hypothetical protein
MPPHRIHQTLVLIALSLATLTVHAAETHTPTQDEILYGTADGQPLTMDAQPIS